MSRVNDKDSTKGRPRFYAKLDKAGVGSLAKRKALGLLGGIFRLLFILGMIYIFLFPVLYMLSVAIREPSSVNDPSVVWLPKALSTESLRTTLEVMNYWESLRLTVVLAVGSTLGALISCTLAGYGLARDRFRGNKLVFGMMLLTIIVPPITTISATFINFRYFDFAGILKLLSPVTGFDHINLLNTPFTFILPSLFGTGIRCGLFIFIFRQFFSGMPGDLEEAACIDGCGAGRTFVQIMLPLARPALITVLLFSFIWNWNDYYTANTFFMDGVKPLSVMLYDLQEMLQSAGMLSSSTAGIYELRTYLQAGSLLMIAPPLVLYIFTQRFFTESIERTGIVG